MLNKFCFFLNNLWVWGVDLFARLLGRGLFSLKQVLISYLSIFFLWFSGKESKHSTSVRSMQMRGAALWPPCSCFQSPEIYGEKNDTRTAGQGLSEKGRGGGVVQIQMNNSTMQQPLAFWIQHYHFTKCFYFGILFIYLLFFGGGGRGWWRKNIVEVAGQIRNLKH